MTLSPRTVRLDLKCGKGAISEGEKCTKGPATKAAIAAGIGLTAGALALGAVAMSKRGRSRPSGATSPSPSSPSPQPRLPGSSPRALLKSAPPRQSKTQRMRENTAAAMRNAEAGIAQTAREEVRRIAQIGNTMAAAGEATGMAAKTTMRELRLRTEAARRRFEPGYRAPDQRRLPPGTQAQLITSTPIPELEAIPLDPRTGQPRRRKPQGFGRTDNFIQHYAPVQLQPPTRRDAQREDVEFLNEKLHAAVKAEAKRKFKVYPSAYANAWMVQEYKQRGGKFRSDALDTWFKEKWVRMSSTGKILGPCGDRTESEGKPKCLPSAKAQALSTAERRTLVQRKRRNDPSKERNGAPIMVSSKTDVWAAGFDTEDGKKYTKVVTNPETGRKNKVRYGAKGYRIAPGTDKGDNYCARSFGDMKSEGYDCSGAERNTPLCLSRAKWKCSGKTSRR